MPLRPAMAAFHPRKPDPREKRAVACPACGHSFSISAKAMSVRCPACTRPLQFSDLDVRQRLAGEIATMGRVGLQRSGEISGRLVCGELDTEGSFQGDALVYGEMTLKTGSLTTGSITCRSVRAEHGSTLRSRLCVQPKPVPRGRLSTLAKSPRQYRPREIKPTEAGLAGV